MSLLLLYGVSVTVAFVGWYGCGPIKSRSARAIVRASLIAILCAPGLLIGHGFAVVPTLFALAVQPSVFTLISIGVVWLVVVGLVLGIPALRRHENRWPPSARELYIDGYIGKYLLFGLIYDTMLGASVYADDSLTIQSLRYALFFGGAALNFALCFHASRIKNANALITPALFSVPVFFIAAAPAVVLWYGSGAAGALVARGFGRIASWVSSAAFMLLAANFVERSFRALDAPSHVEIEGGVTGNAALAALFVGLSIVSWWLLRRYGAMSATGHA
jgi:hypothetical protein